MKASVFTTLAAAGLILAAPSQAAGTRPDWNKAPAFNDDKLVWILQVDGDTASASYGHPESDHVILTLSCDGTGRVAASHVDAGFAPFSRYDVHLRAGQVERSTTGTTRERWDLDDLVELSFILPGEGLFLSPLRKGESLSILFSGPGIDMAGFTVPMPVVDLAPLFKSCHL